jgi:hypothetical protein
MPDMPLDQSVHQPGDENEELREDHDCGDRPARKDCDHYSAHNKTGVNDFRVCDPPIVKEHNSKHKNPTSIHVVTPVSVGEGSDSRAYESMENELWENKQGRRHKLPQRYGLDGL